MSAYLGVFAGLVFVVLVFGLVIGPAHLSYLKWRDIRLGLRSWNLALLERRQRRRRQTDRRAP